MTNKWDNPNVLKWKNSLKIAVHSYHGKILSNKKEQTGTCNNLDGSQGNYAEGKKANHKKITCYTIPFI